MYKSAQLIFQFKMENFQLFVLLAITFLTKSAYVVVGSQCICPTTEFYSEETYKSNNESIYVCSSEKWQGMKGNCTPGIYNCKGPETKQETPEYLCDCEFLGHKKGSVRCIGKGNDVLKETLLPHNFNKEKYEAENPIALDVPEL